MRKMRVGLQATQYHGTQNN